MHEMEILEGNKVAKAMIEPPPRSGKSKHNVSQHFIL